MLYVLASKWSNSSRNAKKYFSIFWTPPPHHSWSSQTFFSDFSKMYKYFHFFKGKNHFFHKVPPLDVYKYRLPSFVSWYHLLPARARPSASPSPQQHTCTHLTLLYHRYNFYIFSYVNVIIIIYTM